jgi:NADH:ubiquinone oxidoreductase subunit E
MASIPPKSSEEDFSCETPEGVEELVKRFEDRLNLMLGQNDADAILVSFEVTATQSIGNLFQGPVGAPHEETDGESDGENIDIE